MKISTCWLLAAGCLLGPPLPFSSLAQASRTNATPRPAMPVQQVLQELDRIYGTKFVFEARLLAGKTTTVRVEPGRSVEELLKAILYPNDLLFLYVDKTHYTIVEKERSAAAATPAATTATETAGTQRTIGGVVQDEQGQPLPGATVLVGTSGRVGVATNANGRFSLAIPASALAMNVSSIGFEDQVIVLSNLNNYAVTLHAKAVGLKAVEVVSDGYETLPRERATGSFGIITSKQLDQIPVPNLVQRLEGQVAGVQLNIQDSDNSFLYENTMVNPTGQNNVGSGSYGLSVRGTSTVNFNVDQRPLLVLDGLPTEFDLRTINPNDVEQLTVLKDAAAASIWGARAANGVIVVQTKKGRYNREPAVSFSTTFTQAGKPRFDYLPLLNAGQFINYEQELVSSRFLTDPGLPTAANSSYYFPRPVTAGQELIFEAQRGTISAAQRDAGLQTLAASGRAGYDQLQQYLLQPAQSQTYDLSVSGGGGIIRISCQAPTPASVPMRWVATVRA